MAHVRTQVVERDNAGRRWKQKAETQNITAHFAPVAKRWVVERSFG